MKNLIYIHTHDTGRYISPYGYAVPTPNLQKLAEKSLLFRNAYCVGPTCSPSRAGMLSGMAPHSAGMLGLAHRGFHMNDYSRHLSAFLQDNGYHTVLAGVQHEAVRRETLGYSEFIGEKELSPDNDRVNADAVSEFLLNRGREKSFFLSFGLQHTHREYETDTGEINPDYVRPVFTVEDNAENRLDAARYMRSVQIADECVGSVINALEASGLMKDTVVIFTTDHGIAMPFMKCTLTDAGIGVAMMIYAEGLYAMGKATDSLVSQLDVFPTVCDLLGLAKPPWLQGKSMLPILANPEAEIRGEIFSEVTYHAAYEPMRCVRTKNYKLIKFFDDYDRVISANIDDSAPKRQILAAGVLDKKKTREMLFDLRLDPVERENLIGCPEYDAVYAELSNKMLDWMLQTDDPILKYSRVPAPKGAIVNTRESLQPYYKEYE